MAEPEIDEAAAVRYCEYIVKEADVGRATHNAASAALAWKSRAEAAEAKVREAAMRATVEQASAKWWRDKCEAAQDDRDSLRRQLESVYKRRYE